MKLPYDATIIPGDVITLLGSSLKQNCTDLAANCSSWPYADEQNVTVVAAQTPQQLQVVLTGASEVGVCSGFTLAGSMSIGAGGRPFSSAVWYVTTSGSSSEADATNVREAVENLAQATTSPLLSLSLSASDLVPGVAYEFVLVLTNFLGISASATHLVTKKTVPVPALSIDGSPTREQLRSEALVLFADAQAADTSCTNSTSSQSLAYTWSVNGIPVTGVWNSARNPRWLRVSTVSVKSLFPSLGTYVVTASVSDGSATNNAMVTLVVKASPLLAVIAGGNRTVGQGEISALALDGTASSDPDAAAGTANGGVTFQWTCTRIVTTGDILVASDCNLPAGLEQVGSVLSGSMLGALAVATYRFTLIVSAGDDTRTASTVVDITVKAGTPPAVAIDATGVGGKVNAGRTFRLPATVASKGSNAVAVWTRASWEGDFSSWEDGANATSTTVAVLAGASTTPVPLVLFPNWLEPGQRYVFKLTATDSFGVAGSSTVVVVVNSPPTSGRLAVSPAKGEALRTSFTMSADSWVDDVEDFPLKYSFAHVAGSVMVWLTSTGSDANMHSAGLPQGSGDNNTVVLVCYVVDTHGASANGTRDVSVLPANITTEEVTTILQAGLSSGDTGAVLEAIGAVSSSLSVIANATTTGSGSGATPATEEAVELRAMLLSALVNASSAMDIVPTAIAQQSVYLELITSEPSQLDSATQTSALAFVGSLAASLAATGSDETLQAATESCGSTLSSLLDSTLLSDAAAAATKAASSSASNSSGTRSTSGDSSGSSSGSIGGSAGGDGAVSTGVVAAKVQEALRSLSLAQLAGAEPGEAATLLSTKNLQMTSVRATRAAFTSNTTLSPPAPPGTATDVAPSFTLDSGVDLGDGDGGVDAQVVRFARNVFSTHETSSDIVTLEFSVDGAAIIVNGSASGGRRRLASNKITLVLPNKHEIDHSTRIVSASFSFTCFREVNESKASVLQRVFTDLGQPIPTCYLDASVNAGCDSSNFIPWHSAVGSQGHNASCVGGYVPQCTYWDEVAAQCGQRRAALSRYMIRTLQHASARI